MSVPDYQHPDRYLIGGPIQPSQPSEFSQKPKAQDSQTRCSEQSDDKDRRKPTNPKDFVGLTKPPMSTVSKLVMAEVGVAMLEGAMKYGRHNYRGTDVLASIYIDAAGRHLDAWYEGQDIDPDSGMSHLTKAIASLTVLRDAEIVGKMVDDRPPAMAPAGFWEDLGNKVKAIIARYGHVKPKHYTEKNRHEH